jgi:death on curing protein
VPRPRFLRAHEIIAFHDAQIAAGGTGNDAGVLNEGAIHAAVERAEHGPFWTTSPDLFDRAAFYLRGIGQEHPFIEGNKRTAFESVDVFLRLHGWKMRLSRGEATEFLLKVAGKDVSGKRRDSLESVSIEGMAAWIRANSEKL